MYRPNRCTSCPTSVDETAIPPISGSSSSPESAALAPPASCRNMGRNVAAPSIAVASSTTAATGIVNVPSRKSRSGSTGSAAARSTSTNSTASSTDPAPSARMTGEDQAWTVPPQEASSVRQVSSPEISTAPDQSIRCGETRLGSLSTANATASAIAPSGRLM
nr:hypothetical protein [Nonomuraea phyllanthi]